MTFPSPDRELLFGSASGFEIAASSIAAKGTFWIVYERYSSLSLKEYDGLVFPKIRESALVFHVSPALNSSLAILTNRFWLWEVTSAYELNLVEIEPFTSASPIIHSVTNITSNVESVRTDIIEGKPVRVFLLKNGSPKQQWLYVFEDAPSGIPTLSVQLQWTATRLDNYDTVIDSTSLTSFQLVYSDTASPPNIYTVSYALSVPQIISASQIGGTQEIIVTWDTIAGGEMYRLERSENDPTFNPINTTIVYYGSNTSASDVAPGYSTTFYYRVKLVMPSLLIESAWSTAVSILTVPAIPFYVYSDRISQDGFNHPVDAYWLSTFGELKESDIPPFVISDPRYWVASSDSTWYDSINWSYTSGGPGGAPIPTFRNVVIFDGGGVGECDIDSTVGIKGLFVNEYPGIIYQNGYEIRVDQSGAIFWTGDFSGSGNNIRIKGNLYIGNVANFLSTDQTLSCDSTFQYYDTASFLHNDGVVSLDSEGCVLEAYNMHMSTFQINTNRALVGDPCYVEDLLILKQGSARQIESDGTVLVEGDMSCRSEYNQWTNYNNLSILLDGTGQQKVYNEIGCVIPTLYVDKEVTEQAICYGGSPLRIKGDFLIYDGTFNTNGLDVRVGLIA